MWAGRGEHSREERSSTYGVGRGERRGGEGRGQNSTQ
jgi:hypothetical protein